MTKKRCTGSIICSANIKYVVATSLPNSRQSFALTNTSPQLKFLKEIAAHCGNSLKLLILRVITD